MMLITILKVSLNLDHVKTLTGQLAIFPIHVCIVKVSKFKLVSKYVVRIEKIVSEKVERLL